jgi:hypothetical protein
VPFRLSVTDKIMRTNKNVPNNSLKNIVNF